MRRPSRRSGFSLAEVLVALLLLGIVGAAMTTLLARQQRFYSGVADVGEIRAQLAQGTTTMSADLRSISPGGGDVVAMSDSAIDFRFTAGSAIACVIPSNSRIVLPPATLSSGMPLSNWLSAPAAGDSVFVFDDGPNPNAATDDTWIPSALSSVTSTAGSCPTSTGYTVAADASAPAVTLNLTASLPNTVLVGAPIRIVRRAHYGLYQSANDRRWYLGYCSPACSAANAIQPVAGAFLPYQPPSSSVTSGIRITYLDKTGVPTAVAANVARISIVLAGASEGPVSTGGFSRAVFTDSLRVNVALRNRS